MWGDDRSYGNLGGEFNLNFRVRKGFLEEMIFGLKDIESMGLVRLKWRRVRARKG